ncbi:MAG TPA: PTS fructose transporter subunit IIA [candidate division Zixibacteria bacterium]|jgi:PTS system fructose-specific IIA component/PTS system nitrogen regulatory IIA component|nr:PTS fructose transporter subunit IIA [candidate division Zixibacteria bacterium]
MPIKLSSLTEASLIIPSLAATDAREVLQELLIRAFTSDRISSHQAAEEMEELVPGVGARVGQSMLREGEEDILRELMHRETLGTTGIGEAVAIPHTRHPLVKEMVMVLGRSHRGIDFNSLDGQPVRLFFMLLIPQEERVRHLSALAEIARLVKAQDFVPGALQAPDAKEILKLLKKAEG